MFRYMCFPAYVQTSPDRSFLFLDFHKSVANVAHTMTSRLLACNIHASLYPSCSSRTGVIDYMHTSYIQEYSSLTLYNGLIFVSAQYVISIVI